MKELIKDIQKKSPSWRFVQKYLLNKYFITIFLFLVWMIFFDSTSWLVIKDLNKEIMRLFVFWLILSLKILAILN